MVCSCRLVPPADKSVSESAVPDKLAAGCVVISRGLADGCLSWRGAALRLGATQLGRLRRASIVALLSASEGNRVAARLKATEATRPTVRVWGCGAWQVDLTGVAGLEDAAVWQLARGCRWLKEVRLLCTSRLKTRTWCTCV